MFFYEDYLNDAFIYEWMIYMSFNCKLHPLFYEIQLNSDIFNNDYT